MPHRYAEIAFTPTVKKAQEELGSRNAYARMEGAPETQEPSPRRGGGSIHRGSKFVLHGDGQRNRLALHPASRWADRIRARA